MAQGGAGRSAGMTLLELLLAIGLLGLLMALALPAFANFIGDSRLVSERNRLAADLRYGRNEAIYNNSQVVACPSADLANCSPAPEWHSGWLVFMDDDLDREHDPDESILRAGNAMAYVETLAPRTRRRIRFHGNGRAPGSNATITFCDRRGSEHAVALIISNGGHIRRAERGPSARPLRCNSGS